MEFIYLTLNNLFINLGFNFLFLCNKVLKEKVSMTKHKQWNKN